MNLDLAVNNIKPPIFWKEKPIMLQHAKKWQKQTLKEALLYIGRTELPDPLKYSKKLFKMMQKCNT